MLAKLRVWKLYGDGLQTSTKQIGLPTSDASSSASENRLGWQGLGILVEGLGLNFKGVERCRVSPLPGLLLSVWVVSSIKLQKNLLCMSRDG